jgi:hypothetical protein
VLPDWVLDLRPLLSVARTGPIRWFRQRAVAFAIGAILQITTGIADIIVLAFDQVIFAVTSSGEALLVAAEPAAEVAFTIPRLIGDILLTINTSAGPFAPLMWVVATVFLLILIERFGRAIIIGVADAIPGGQAITTLLGVES